jgi:dihydropteroate synthase
MVKILGILNLTRDSFSDGGEYLDPQRAIAHAEQLTRDGAWAIDVGAQSTHPDAEPISADQEIARLEPVVPILKQRGLRVSVDTYRPAVMRKALKWGVDLINDVTGMRDAESVSAVRSAACRLVVMHSRSSGARAERMEAEPGELVNAMIAFFSERVGTLTTAGIDRDRLILDPGMGFFLGSNPQASFTVLRELPRLRALGLPLLVSTSRKSFIGAALANNDEPRPTAERGAGTLATELWAALQGVQYLRTHDVRALRDGLMMVERISHCDPDG